MNHGQFEQKIENEKANLTPPPIELLTNPEKAKEAWPKLSSNEEFLEQIEERKELNDRLDAVLSHIPQPDMPLEDALAEGRVTETQVVELYTSLTALLKNHDYARAILYMPFEFLPHSAADKFETEALKEAANGFREACVNAWESLLEAHDVRANFVDGDILELDERHGDWPRVVKAAHLIPKLIEHGLITAQNTIQRMENTRDGLLKKNIAESLQVTADLGFLTSEDIDHMRSSKDEVVRETAELITSFLPQTSAPEFLTPTDTNTLRSKLHSKLQSLETADYGPVSKNRRAWLKEEKQRQAFTEISQEICKAIMNGEVTPEIIKMYIDSDGSAMGHACIEGLRLAIETITKTDNARGRGMFNAYREIVTESWKEKRAGTQDALVKMFFRLNALGVIDMEELKTLEITRPNLAGPQSENLERMGAEMHDVERMLEAVQASPELLQKIYPLLLMHGSRLKGYSLEKSDIDISVVVRPETTTEDRKKIEEMLKAVFVHKKIPEKVIEFWLIDKNNELFVRDFDTPDDALGDKTFVHVLFGGAWKGNQEAIQELREKLLTPYFYDAKETLYDREARAIYLEQLERDALQYRLMHKGYERFFPKYGGIQSEHADLIDGQSAFWDSGYRRMALKLFASRVFLPKLSQEK